MNKKAILEVLFIYLIGVSGLIVGNYVVNYQKDHFDFIAICTEKNTDMNQTYGPWFDSFTEHNPYWVRIGAQPYYLDSGYIYFNAINIGDSYHIKGYRDKEGYRHITEIEKIA